MRNLNKLYKTANLMIIQAMAQKIAVKNFIILMDKNIILIRMISRIILMMIYKIIKFYLTNLKNSILKRNQVINLQAS